MSESARLPRRLVLVPDEQWTEFVRLIEAAGIELRPTSDRDMDYRVELP